MQSEVGAKFLLYRIYVATLLGPNSFSYLLIDLRATTLYTPYSDLHHICSSEERDVHMLVHIWKQKVLLSVAGGRQVH